MSDGHRGKVYEGEYKVRGMLDFANQENGARMISLGGSSLTLPVERKFASLESIQAYVDAVLALPTIRNAYPDVGPVRVRARKGGLKAHYEHGGVIAIPMEGRRWACREMVVLHELAHHLTASEHANHGVRFRAAFVKLTTVAMSPEVGFALQICWHLSGVAA
jgi:putative metallohydrolase (TIGR04338 family)